MAWFAWIGKEADRRPGANQDHLFGVGKGIKRLLDDIGDTIDGRATCTALHAPVGLLRHQSGAGGCRYSVQRVQLPFSERKAGGDDRRFPA